MANVVILLARGFEETEAIVPIDLLKRAGANVTLVSTEGDLLVAGAHDLSIAADITLEELRKEEMDCLVLPGGAMGTELLGENPQVISLIEYAASKGIIIAAICAAPSILGKMGLLEGRNAAVYPGYDDESMQFSNITGKKVEHDDIFITAEGMGVAFEFGFKIVEVLFGADKVTELQTQTRFI